MCTLRGWLWTSVLALMVSTILGTSARTQDPPDDKTPWQDGVLQDGVLWTDPGDPSLLDFEYGVGGPEGQPQPPFRFIKEDSSGTSPKVMISDARGEKWSVKWGEEARPSTFCTRLVWACGYYAEPEYFISMGRIEGARGLSRAASAIARDGSFKNARFQLRADSPVYMGDSRWTWKENPFVGSHELQGLKILMLILSNWDTKASNLAIFRDDALGRTRYIFADVDWGASLGKWGHTFTWSKWDCKGFTQQTPQFVKGLTESGEIKWGFNGKNRTAVTNNITTEDVKWLLQYLGKITDEQIRAGLVASGASPDEVVCYCSALRQRIEQLQKVAGEIQ